MAKAKNNAPVEAGGKVLCAVLCDCVYGKHDEILELDANVAEAAYAAGYVDTHPNAIKAIRAAKGAKADV